MSKTKDQSSDEQLTTETSSSPDASADLIAVITSDEFAGQGGSYTYDPATGKRTKNLES